MPQTRYDPYFGTLPPAAQDPSQVMQNPQAGGPQDASNLIWQMIQKNLGAQPPHPRRLTNWEIFAGLSNPDLMNVALGRRYDTPEMMQYEAGQKALPSMVQAYGATQRTGMAGEREARLQEQFKWRQMMQSQFKPDTMQTVNPQTGVSEWLTIYRDPLRNNMEVFRETTAYPPVHYGAVVGPRGEMQQYPTTIRPSAEAPAQGGPAGGGMIPRMSQPTGTPTRGGNVTGTIPAGQGTQDAPPANTMRPQGGTGIFKSAPASLTEQATRQSKFLSGLEGAFSTIDAAHTAQVNRFCPSPIGMIGQVAQDKLAQGRYGRAFVSKFGDPEVVNYYNKIRLSVYDYVKAQTGAQFSITEMDRYLASFPTSVDDQETAKGLIREHALRAVREINTLKLNWQSIQVGNQRIYVSPDYLQEFLEGGAGVGTQPETQSTAGGPSPELTEWMRKRGHTVKP